VVSSSIPDQRQHREVVRARVAWLALLNAAESTVSSPPTFMSSFRALRSRRTFFDEHAWVGGHRRSGRGRRGARALGLLGWLLVLLGPWVSAPALAADYSNWMRDHYAVIQDKALGELVIPGTHDAGTYSLVDPWDLGDPRNFEIDSLDIGSPDKASGTRVGLGIVGSITKYWGGAQIRNITQQLEDGIRSLDLRVAADKKGVLRFCHGLYGDRVDQLLDEVKRFSDTHTNEIIILSFWAFHDWAAGRPGTMRAEKHTELIQMIESRFVGRIATLDVLNPQSRVREFVERQKTIVISYGNRAAGDEDSQDRDGAWFHYGKDHNFWVRNDGLQFSSDNKGYTGGKIQGSTAMSSARVISTNQLYDLTGLSVDEGLIGAASDLFGNYPRSSRELGRDVTPVMVGWLRERDTNGDFVWASPNVVSLDHYDLSCLVETCLERNGVANVDFAGCDFGAQSKWGHWQTGVEAAATWSNQAVVDAGNWFSTAYTNVNTFFSQVGAGISSVFTQTFEPALAGTAPADGVAAGVRHYVITAQRIEVLSAPADWEGDLELYGQVFMVPSPFAFTDPGANKTFWSLPEGDQGRTKIGSSLQINGAKNLYVKEEDAAGFQVAMGGVLYDDEFGLFAGLGDHLLELDLNYRQVPLTFDLGSLEEGEAITESVIYSKPNVAQVAVYFRAERLVAPLIPKAPPFEWTQSARRGVTVDRLTRVGAGLLQASAGVPGRIEYLPAEGTFLPPGSRGEVFATFIPDDRRRYLEHTLSRSVVVPQVVRPVPGKIEAENFDAFFEAGGTLVTPATSDAGGGKEVASLPAGGWVAYQISATADYQYVARLRVATVNPRQQLRLQIDGRVVGADIHLPFTGGLGAWMTVELPAIRLTAGFHRVQVEWLTSGASLNYLELGFPAIEEYTQNFDAFADGTTALEDRSNLTSTHLGQAARVRGGALRLGDDQVANSTSTFTPPALSTNGLPTFMGFEVSFDYRRYFGFPPESFAFQYGTLTVQLDASVFRSLLVTVGGQPIPGGSPPESILEADVPNPVTIRWSKQSGAGRLSVAIRGQGMITEIPTPAFDPSAADVMALVARNGGGILATVEIDNLKVSKLPPETRVLTAEIGPADVSLVELGGFSFPFSVRNEGNAPATVRSLVPSEGSTSESSFVLRPGEGRELRQFVTYRGDGPYHVSLEIFSDATAGVDGRGAQRLEFDALISGPPSGAKVMARFPLDADGNSDDRRFVASEVRDVTFVGGGARAGSVGSAVFNGASSRIQHPWNDLLNPRVGNAAGSFTVSAWVKAEAVATLQDVVSSGTRAGSDSTGYGLSTGSGTAWEFWTGTGSGAGEAPIARGPQPRFGEWQHLAAVYDAGRQRKTLLVDGEPVATQEVAVAPNLDRVLNLGSGGDTGEAAFFRGALDDVAIFAGALTRGEVARVMAGDYAPFEPPPGDRLLGVVGGSSNFGTVEAIDGKIRGRWVLNNTGTAPITIRKFILPPGVTVDWNGGTLAPQQTREIIVTKEVTSPGPVFWQIIANSDGNVSVDEQGNTHFTLRAEATMASFVVTSTADSGPGSLRQVLADAAAHAGGDTVTFAPGFKGPIRLQSELLLQDSNRITIDATGLERGVVVEGEGTHRLVQISAETVAAFKHMTLTGGAVGGGFPEGYGGALYVEGVLTMSGCTLSGNSAYAGGAAFVVANPTSSLTLNRCTVSHNSADFGGGIQSEGLLVIASSTFSLNTAGVVGGAISSPSTTLTLIQTTISSNTAGQGGGIFGTKITLQNSIVAGNTATRDPNVVGEVTGTGVNWTAGDPMLGPLADNGGPTETMALLANSPGLNAAGSSIGSTDQRGLPISGAPDLGAYEAQPEVVVFVNQAPRFVRGADQSVAADSGPQVVAGWATEISPGAAEESAQVLTFSVATDRPALFSASPAITANGTLTFTPALDAQGVATVTVVLRDDGGTQNGGVDTSVAQTFAITLLAPPPKSLVVRNGEDSGPGSLRQILAEAASRPGPDLITFLPGFTGPITLESELLIDDQGGVTVDARDLAAGMTVRAQGEHRLFHLNAGAKVDFHRLTLTGGKVTGFFPEGYGGALYIEGSLTLTECTLTGNSAYAGGVAFVAASFESNLEMQRCTVSGNTASFGGGIQSEGRMTITSSTLTQNTASEVGGAISSPSTVLTLIHSTLSGNVAGSRGGGIMGTELTLENCIVAGNTAPADANLTGTVTSLGVNLVSGDPLLASLAANGGPTFTMALQSGSPARDAALGSAATTDQRGLPRVGTPDVGAFELQPGDIVVNPTLTIRLLGGSAMVSWESAEGYLLEETRGLGLDASWTVVAFTTRDGISSAVISDPGVRAAFFRLRRAAGAN
jgi:predicted outer membrane repeat protein